jgi:energy-coupling factor transporter transmembrane protein EcfT
VVEVTLFHYRDKNTLLNNLHPLTKVLYLLIFSTLLVTNSLLRVSLILTLFIIVGLFNSLPFKSYKKEAKVFLFIGLLMGFFRFLNATSFVEPVVIVLRFLAVVMMGLIFTDTTAFDDLARSFGDLLYPLLGSKSYKISAHFELTLSVIPLLFDVAFQASEARKARGGSFKKKILKNIVEYVSDLFNLLLIKAEELEYSLISRSYSLEAKRESIKLTVLDLKTTFALLPFILLFIFL